MVICSLGVHIPTKLPSLIHPTQVLVASMNGATWLMGLAHGETFGLQNWRSTLLVLWKRMKQFNVRRPQKFRIFINDGLRMHSCSMEIDDLGWNWGSSDLLVPVFVEHVSWQKDRFNLLGVCVGVLGWTLWEVVHALQEMTFLDSADLISIWEWLRIVLHNRGKSMTALRVEIKYRQGIPRASYLSFPGKKVFRVLKN